MDVAHRHRILIVEDHDADMVRMMITRSRNPIAAAATVVAVRDLASARAELTSEPYDLILLDLELPDGTGLDLAQEITRSTNPHRPIVIAVTASAIPAERDRILAQGCDDFVSKPYDPHQLVNLAVKHLTNRAATA
ncbi:response regulator [Actinoplanes sp. NEAU-A12]|uniref:Response regulator n=1 Tax=Actinoplanes sandaracinus TaxID=3045177 RepID=A0ABT6WVZ8_9ACTN|nr:response regulator [Actinoplanes sandaracinus]MDI6103806.1 response regulator [Actinoplanes sandaracinus]